MNLRYSLSLWLWRCVSRLPLGLLYVLSDVLIFPIAFHLLKYRRALVREHLAACFPQRTASQRQRIERDFYRWFADYMVETLKEMTISVSEMRQRMEFVGFEQIEADLQREGKRFAFLYLGHYCNWEWVASLPCHSQERRDFAQIYHPLHSDTMERLFLHMRGRFGAKSVPMKHTLRTILQLKAEGKSAMVGFISDQSPKWEATHFWTRFLNHDTAFFVGAERIGQKVDAAYYYAEMSRPRRGYYRCRLHRLQPDPGTSDYPITEAYARAMERTIQAQPHLWLWTHNRWKRTKESWERIKSEEQGARGEP